MSTLDLRSSLAPRRRDVVKALVPGDGWSWTTAVQRAADLLLTWHRQARQRRQLQFLSDHMLRDIGLTRADVLAESSKPFWQP
jgi:uncharacterized protein YjiS (DUF1127 family)